MFYDWTPPNKGPGFPCDMCSGKHAVTYSCKTCGRWVCPKHAVIETKERQYELPEKTSYCTSCDPTKANR